MHRDQRARPRRACTVHELAVMLEDALSAAAGWTVIPPDIYPVESTLGGPNWTVDLRLLDGRMLDAVRSLQDRYELRTERLRVLQILLRFFFPGKHSQQLRSRADASDALCTRYLRFPHPTSP